MAPATSIDTHSFYTSVMGVVAEQWKGQRIDDCMGRGGGDM